MRDDKRDLFYKDVRNQAFNSQSIGTKLYNNEGTGADGGNLIGTDVATAVVDKIFTESSYVAEAERFEVKTSRNKIKIPFSANLLVPNASTGTRAYWTAEAAALTESKMELGNSELTLGKITTLIYATDELIEDVSFAGSMIEEYAAKAAHVLIANDMLFGTDAIKGIFNDTVATQFSPFTSTPTEAELGDAFQLVHPALISGAKWYVDMPTYCALSAANYDIIDRSDGMTVLGLPVVINPYLTGATANAHIFLGNFKAYGLAYKAPKNEKNITIQFLTDQSAYRLTMRIAGDVITKISECADGADRGAFVIPTVTP